MVQRESLGEIFLRSMKIYSPEYLINREVLYPSEVVISIIRGFNLYEWLLVFNKDINANLLKYLKQINYYRGVERVLRKLCHHIS